MIANILSVISIFISGLILKIGYAGVFFLMALESANIPIPSEIIMPFSGFLAVSGKMNFWVLVLAGTFGNLFGSWVSYFIAFKLGDKLDLFLKNNKFLSHDYFMAKKFFEKWGNLSVFLGRMLPIIRTFISFPAGIFKISFWKFTWLTLVGSFIWTAFLGWFGFYMGEKWSVLEIYFRKFDYLIIGLFFVFLAIYIFWRRKKSRYPQ